MHPLSDSNSCQQSQHKQSRDLCLQGSQSSSGFHIHCPSGSSPGSEATRRCPVTVVYVLSQTMFFPLPPTIPRRQRLVVWPPARKVEPTTTGTLLPACLWFLWLSQHIPQYNHPLSPIFHSSEAIISTHRRPGSPCFIFFSLNLLIHIM